MTPTEHLWLKVVTPPIITPGKVVTAFILIGFGKSKIFADYLDVYLVHPNGSKTPLEAIGIEPELYMVSFTILEDHKYDTCSILVDAYYWFLGLSDVSALTISKELALIPSIEENVGNITKELGSIAKGLENIATSIDDLIKMMKTLEPVIIEVKNNTVKMLTGLGTMDAKLDTIKDLVGKLGTTIIDVEKSIKEDILVLKTDIGELKATLSALEPKIKSIDERTATIETKLEN